MPQSQNPELTRKATRTLHNGRAQLDDTSHFAVTARVSPQEAYAFFRDFENLPKFMKGLKQITVLSNTRSEWVVESESGAETSWEAEMTEDRPDKISWRSVEGSPVTTSGSIWFSPAPADKGCQISLAMDFELPGGGFTKFFTKLMAEDPDTLARTNLKRLKAILETGELATIEGQSSGREAGSEKIVTH